MQRPAGMCPPGLTTLGSRHIMMRSIHKALPKKLQARNTFFLWINWENFKKAVEKKKKAIVGKQLPIVKAVGYWNKNNQKLHHFQDIF